MSSKVDQGVQANDLPKPNLNLSTFLEQEEENNKSVSIALQTGDSIREIRDTLKSEKPTGEAGKQSRETLGRVSINSQKLMNVFGDKADRQTKSS